MRKMSGETRSPVHTAEKKDIPKKSKNKGASQKESIAPSVSPFCNVQKHESRFGLNGISSDNPLDKKLGFLRCADLFAVFSFPHLGQVARFLFSAPTNKSQHRLWGSAVRSDAQNLTKNKSNKKLNFKQKSVFVFLR